MPSFSHRTVIHAPVEVVFDLLTDHRGYASFTPLRSVTLEREGEPAPNGVGAIRILRLAGPPLREEVTEYVPPSRFAYRLLSGAPVRDYTATVDLLPESEGTWMTYTVQGTPTVPPVLAPLLMGVMRIVIARLIAAIKKQAERAGA